MFTPLRITVLATSVLTAGLVLAACSSGSDSSQAGSSPSAAPSSSAAGGSSSSGGSSAGSGQTVTASETEFSIKLSSSSLSAGTYTFNVSNDGKITHALTIDGPGVSDMTTGDIKPGSSATMTVTLASGSYDVFCPVGNHKMLGMDDTVTVS